MSWLSSPPSNPTILYGTYGTLTEDVTARKAERTMQGTIIESKKELLGKLLRGGALNSARRQAIQPRDPAVTVPMSYGQQQVWLHSQFSTAIPIYNEPVTVHRYGALDRSALEKAFTEIVRRHEAWRTVFGWKGSELVQLIQPPPEHIAIPFLDVSAVPSETREVAALEIATADALAPFDLAVGPMYRPRLIRFSEDEHRLYLSLHHIIFDGVSLYRVFLPELQALYDAFSAGQPSPLPPMPLQYGDYAIWHRKWVDQITPQQLAFWQEKLSGVVRRDILRPDHPRAATQSYRGAMETLALSMEVTAGLKELSRSAGVTLFITLLATFLTLIWAYTREEDLVIGSTSAGRNRSETDNMLGFFLNTIVLRTDMSGDPTFLDVIQRGREELLSSLANDGIPFENLVKELHAVRDGGKSPFFQVLFSFEPPLAPLQPNWKFTQMDIETGAAKFDLHLELDERHDGIIGRFIYNSDLFEQSTIVKMLHDWRDIVFQVVVDPSRPVSQMVPALEKLRKPVIELQSSPGPEPEHPSRLVQSIRKLFSKSK